MDKKIFISLIFLNLLAFSAWAALHPIDNFEGTLSGWGVAPPQEKYDTDGNPDAITADATDASLRIENATPEKKDFIVSVGTDGDNWELCDDGRHSIGFWFYGSSGTTNLVIEIEEEDVLEEVDPLTGATNYVQEIETWQANHSVSGVECWSFEFVDLDVGPSKFTRVSATGDTNLVENLDIVTSDTDPVKHHRGVLSFTLKSEGIAGATNYVDSIVLTNLGNLEVSPIPGAGGALFVHPNPDPDRDFEDLTLRCSPPTFSAVLSGTGLDIAASSVRIVALPKYGYADDELDRPGGEGLLNNCNQPLIKVGTQIIGGSSVGTSDTTPNDGKDTIFATLDPDVSFELGRTYVAFIVPRSTGGTGGSVGDAKAVYFTLKREDSTVPMRTDYYRVYHGELSEEEDGE